MSDTDPRIRATHCNETTLTGVGRLSRQQRHTFCATVEALVLDGHGTRLEGTTADISHQGVFINAEPCPALDTLVVLKFHSKLGTLQVATRVVHSIGGIGFGCEFIDLTEEQRQTLSAWVGLSAAAPQPMRTLH
jgi:hypothetical protein